MADTVGDFILKRLQAWGIRQVFGTASTASSRRSAAPRGLEFVQVVMKKKPAQQGCVEIVNLLLSRGANTEAAMTDGWTPAMTASSKGHPEVLKLLIDHGTNLAVRDKRGAAALDLVRSDNDPAGFGKKANPMKAAHGWRVGAIVEASATAPSVRRIEVDP